MNNQELIERLHETSQALEQLAQHLSEINQTDIDSENSTEENNPTELTDTVCQEAETENEIQTETESKTEIEVESDNIVEPEIDGLIIETTFEPIDEDSSDNNSNEKDAKTQQQASAQPTNQNNNNPFAKIVNNLLSKPLPNANNMGGFNPLQMLTGGLPGLSGGLPGLSGGLPGIPGLSGGLPGLGNLGGLNSQSLPTTLAELHDNPQLLGMIKNVSNNPQMLNMLSALTGQDSQTLQQTLQSLQPNIAPAENIMPNAAAAAQNAQSAPSVSIPQAAQTAQVPPAFSAFSAAPMPNELPNVSTTPYLDSLLNEWHWQPYARAWDF